MSGVIYLRQGEGLVPMTESAYDSEDVLQRLLADYPDLLAGEQVNAAAPRRWLLVAREAGLPSEEGGGNRWSIDHLFLDQDGIPTIIEVKRSSDTRIRREVVGQMLDYAANAVVYWPVETLRAKFESQCDVDGIDAEQRILEALEIDTDIDTFWQQVRTNLQAGRVRMIFVGDVIPNELRRVVEFLNGQMNPAEVLAVEVKQYVGQGQQALIPRVIGQTQLAVSQKGTTSSRASRTGTPWNEHSFFEDFEASDADAARVARRFFDWATSRSVPVGWGSGRFGSFFPIINPEDRTSRLFTISRNVGKPPDVYLELERIAQIAPFTNEATRELLWTKLNAINGIAIPREMADKNVQVDLMLFYDEQALQQVLATFDWVIEEIRKQ